MRDQDKPGLRGCILDRTGVGLDAGIPSLERGPRVVVQDLCPD
jgi:hypothetical protein